MFKDQKEGEAIGEKGKRERERNRDRAQCWSGVLMSLAMAAHARHEIESEDGLPFLHIPTSLSISWAAVIGWWQVNTATNLTLELVTRRDLSHEYS